MYDGWLAEGFARRPEGVRPASLRDRRQLLGGRHRRRRRRPRRDASGPRASTSAGMGARDMNFHKQVFARMGYEAEAEQIQDLFLEGRRDEAIAAVPRSLAADISLVGSREQIRDQLADVGGGRGDDAGRRWRQRRPAPPHGRGRARRVKARVQEVKRVLPCAR